MFIVLLSFSSSLAIKCLSLNDGSGIVTHPLLDLHPVELKYYPFLVILDNCSGSHNVLPPKDVFKKNKRSK